MLAWREACFVWRREWLREEHTERIELIIIALKFLA
jgi:hypothetical protein